MVGELGGSPLEALRGIGSLRVAIVGIGNELNGDDAAGVLAARALMRAQPGEAPLRAGVLVIDGGPAPESFTGPLRRFAPALVILIDAAEMGAAPGTARVFDWQDAAGLSASTHTMPPSMLAKFLMLELGCRVALVGIQPQRLDFDAPLSEPVREAVEQVAARLRQFLDESASRL